MTTQARQISHSTMRPSIAENMSAEKTNKIQSETSSIFFGNCVVPLHSHNKNKVISKLGSWTLDSTNVLYNPSRALRQMNKRSEYNLT